MKRVIKAAEGDYIKIGDKIIPTNTADLGYQSFDDIARIGKRRYDDEKAKEAEAKKIQEDRKRGEENLKLIEKRLGDKDAGDKLDVYHEILVPGTGKADTVAGELVRAMMRIMYRDYNDGDRFYEGYGWETCMPSAAYLMDYFANEPIQQVFIDIAQQQYMDDDQYTEKIKAISDMLIEYIDEHPELFGRENTEDSRDYDIPSYYDELEGKYDLDFSIPDAILELERQGKISDNDIRWELESWENLSRGDLEVNGDYAIVTDLDKDTYDELSRTIDRDLQYWEEEWISEYGDPYEDDSEDDYYDEYDEEDEWDEDEE